MDIKTKIETYVRERVQNMTSEEREAKEIPFKRLRKEIFVKYIKLDPNISSKRAEKKYKKYPDVCKNIKEKLIVTYYIHERVQNMTSEEREAKEIPFERLRKEIFVKYFKLDPNISSKRAEKKYEKNDFNRLVCRTIKERLELELLELFPKLPKPKRKKKSPGVKSVVIPKEPHKSTAPENVTILSRCGLRQLPSGRVMGRVSVRGDIPVMYEVTFFYEDEALIFVDKMKHKHGIPFDGKGSGHAKPQNVK